MDIIFICLAVGVVGFLIISVLVKYLTKDIEENICHCPCCDHPDGICDCEDCDCC